jgi:hypothetical protein
MYIENKETFHNFLLNLTKKNGSYLRMNENCCSSTVQYQCCCPEKNGSKRLFSLAVSKRAIECLVKSCIFKNARPYL